MKREWNDFSLLCFKSISEDDLWSKTQNFHSLLLDVSQETFMMSNFEPTNYQYAPTMPNYIVDQQTDLQYRDSLDPSPRGSLYDTFAQSK